MASPLALDARPGNLGINADLQEVAHQLHQEFADGLAWCEVDECLFQVASKFENANVRSFVPLLVQQHAQDELRARLTRP
jgi:hypothetical protein